MTNKLSVIILTRNSEKTLNQCLLGVYKLANEILIIDDYSNDETFNIAKKFKVKFYKRKLTDFSDQRNFGLYKAKYNWVLFIDSDEIVSRSLAFEIKNKLNGNENISYLIKRTDIFNGHKLKYGEVGETKILRLSKKNAGSWKRGVHEEWVVKGKIELLKNELKHYSHANLREFYKSVKFFAEIHAIENLKENKKSNLFKIIIWPFAKFINSYFLKLGFLDGWSGFLYSFMMSLHSFLSWYKLWQIQNIKK